MPDLPLPPPLAVSARILTSSFTILADTCVYVAGAFEIAAGVVLDIDAGGCLELG